MIKTVYILAFCLSHRIAASPFRVRISTTTAQHFNPCSLRSKRAINSYSNAPAKLNQDVLIRPGTIYLVYQVTKSTR
ncbi:hypothetical protein DL98DRAFT_281655 [Cadophora sp. DSE1049]|nr:hypothetical protein DL98DRAFT_281655 [Cadophora sp. DSE1049]